MTLATKRSTAENVVSGTNLNQLVIEPFANPFRVYPLKEDCESFERLFAKVDVACYILNTGFFLDKKVTPNTTLSIIESIVENTAQFKPFGSLEELSYMEIEGYEVNFEDIEYTELLKERIQLRKEWIKTFNAQTELKLPDNYVTSLEKLQQKLK